MPPDTHAPAVVSAHRRGISVHHCISLALGCLAVPAVLTPALGQQISPAAYYRQLPPPPDMVERAKASARLHLYGDPASPGYADRAPVDGIDDRRAAHLLTIAERFSPILRRHHLLVPRDVWTVVGEDAVLEIDTFLDGKYQTTDSVRFDAISSSAGRSAGRAVRSSVDDAKLLAVLDEFGPERDRPTTVSPGPRRDRVLFFDVPGHDEKTWREEEQRNARTESRVYAHFLIHEDTAPSDGRKFMLAVQYLFFYPYNDGGNNHEGDWEHINVLITARASVTDTNRTVGFLDSTAIGTILNGHVPVDSLAIERVDYFFHEYVLPVNYRSAHRANPPPRTFEADTTTNLFWEDTHYMRRVIRERLFAHRGAFATHPIGYIGGSNKGLDELLHPVPRFRWSNNKNTGATYPFPGTWQSIGPVKATERVVGPIVPDVVRGTVFDDRGAPHPGVRLNGDEWVSYTRDNIELLPDWELLLPHIRRDAGVRRRWAWLVLPVRWGYPATRSPGAGAVKETDLGNLAPFGPAFKAWWNEVGPDENYPRFEFRALRTPMSARASWSIIQNGWGFLNYPLILTQIFPFYNMAGGHLWPFGFGISQRIGLEFPRTFVAGSFERIATVGIGATSMIGGEDIARSLVRLAASDDGVIALQTDNLGEQLALSSSMWPRYMLDLHIGKSYFLENSFSMGDAIVHYDAALPNGDNVSLAGTASIRQLTGGMRTPIRWIAAPHQELFARLGAGWTWYTVRDATVNGDEIPGRQKGGYHPPLLPGSRSWPNFGYGGVTYEIFSDRDNWLVDRLGFGVRLDATFVLQRFQSYTIGIDRTDDLWKGRGEWSITGTIGW